MNKYTCDLHDNIDESVDQLRKSMKQGYEDNLNNKSGEVNIVTIIILGVLILSVVVAMIFANVPVSVN